MKRNKERLASQGSPAANSAINLPFIIVSTDKKTTIDCSISSDKYVISCEPAHTIKKKKHLRSLWQVTTLDF